MNIKAATWPLVGAGEGMKRLATAVWGNPLRLHQTRGDAARAEPLDRYVSNGSQSLAVFQFLSFTMGAGLVFALNPID